MELGLRRVVDGSDDDPLGCERRTELVAPEPRLGRGQLLHAFVDLEQGFLGRAPVGRANRHASDHLVEEAGNAHHEELVEVVREDAAELDPFEQGLAGVGGQLEHTLVQVEPRELAVQQGRPGGLGLGSLGGGHEQIIMTELA